MPTISVPSIGEIDFPDSMNDDQISAAIIKNYPQLKPRDAADNLPETLNVAGFDTGINIPKKLSAALVGMGEGMTSTLRGVKQLAGVDEDSMKADAQAMRELKGSPTVGGYATGGSIAGNIVDPVNLLPVGKAASVVGAVGRGAAAGTVAGGLGYVDEGETRLGNAAKGTAFGGVAGGAVTGGVNVVRKLRGKEMIPMLPKGNIDTVIPPNQALNTRSTDVEQTPERIEQYARTREAQADKLPEAETPRSLDEPLNTGAGTISFLGTGQIKNSLKALGDTYQKYAGKPLWEFAQNNPGASLSGVGGGVSGYQSADDDAPMTEKLARAAIGAGLGFGAAKGAGRIPTKDGNLSETASKLFINNYGLPDDYVKAKAGRSVFSNEIASDFTELAKEAATLPANQRRILYNIMQGEAPQAQDLGMLNEKARQTITQYGQKMVDYGMLDPETFKKNAATYLHREYTSKLGNKSVLPEFAARKLKLIGDELRPRGYVVDVPESRLQDYLDAGGVVEGKAKNGAQKVRLQLSKEQRQEMGEIEDAAYGIAKTGQLMSKDISAYKFFDDIATNPNFASDVPVDGWVQLSGDKLRKTAINKFGNLAGKYVPEEIADDINTMDMARSIKNMPAIREYLKLNAMWKTSKTALNPAVHVNNVMSNFALYDLTDAKWAHLKDAGIELFQAGRGKNAPLFDMAKNAGVFDSNFASNELSSLSKQQLDAYLKLEGANTNPIQAAVNVAKAGWQKTGGKMIDLYQNEDNLFRLGVFIDRIQKGEPVEKAAADARKSFVDYDINAPAINLMRNTATPFIAYTYGVVPRLAEAATTKPWKFAKWAALGYGLNAVGEKYGGGNAKQERPLMTDRQKGNIFGLPFMPPQMMKLPTDINGTPQYLDVTRWVPGGDVMDVQEGQFIPGAPAPLQPSFGAAGSIAQAGFGIDAFKRKQLEGLGLGNTEDAKVKGKFLAQQFMPNFPGVPGAYSTTKIADAVHGKPGLLGDRLPPWQAALQTLGIKITPADLPKMQMRAQFEVLRDIQVLEQRARSLTMDLQRGRITENQYAEQFKEIQDEAQARMARLNVRVNSNRD